MVSYSKHGLGIPGPWDQGDEEVRDQGPQEDTQPVLQRNLPGKREAILRIEKELFSTWIF